METNRNDEHLSAREDAQRAQFGDSNAARRREEREREMFGLTVADLELFVERYVGPELRWLFPSRQLAAVSILSDAQELLELGEKNKARQAINRAKWLLSSTPSPRTGGR